MRVLRCLGSLASRLRRSVVLLSALSLPVLTPSPGWDIRPGTIIWMRSRPPGCEILVDAMMVDAIGADYYLGNVDI